jgi:hypothetical protein
VERESEEAGIKFGEAFNVRIHDNQIRNNCGNGVWLDVGSDDVDINHNTIVGNQWQGVMFEISHRAHIFSNQVHDNGLEDDRPCCFGAGIMIANSDGDPPPAGGVVGSVNVHDNTLTGNKHGIIGFDRDRSDAGGIQLRHMDVHDNTVRMDNVVSMVEVTGVVLGTDGPGDPFSAGADNHFENNDYRISAPMSFRWNGSKNWTQWKAAGHDNTGSCALIGGGGC